MLRHAAIAQRGLPFGALLLALATAPFAPAPLDAQRALAPLPAGVEAISLLGDTLRAPALAPAVRAGHEARLREALDAVASHPSNVDSLIWLGRRTAYLGRYRESIDVYTNALARHPADARLWRHRGHRWLTVRQLDSAVHDFERAAQLVRGTPDQIEPDGLPNARNTPTSTLQSNIWYHLGLAHYLRGDFARALDAYRQAMTVSSNPDMLVATSHWLYMTLRRLGRDAEAAAVLAPIGRDMDIIENQAYHRLLLLYKGELPVDSLLPPAVLADSTAPLDPAVAYGVGNWHLYEGRPAEAERVFRRTVASDQWAAFGSLAAEAELARRTTQGTPR